MKIAEIRQKFLHYFQSQGHQIVPSSSLVPANDPLIDPILTVVPMQLIAYHIADLNGTDVDQPRNLAKSVTVE